MVYVLGRIMLIRPILLLALCLPTLLQAASFATRDGMAIIPAGPFIMGSDSGPEDERPSHEIVLAAFAIDRFPVTNAAFAEFLNAAGDINAAGERIFDAGDPDARIRQSGGRWTADKGYEHHPVIEVSWAGARDYCAWRGKRLPTEA